MQKQKRVICMVGLPYSGKTTIAKEYRFPVLNVEGFKPDNRINLLSQLLEDRNLVVVDGCNTSQEEREQWRHPNWRVQYHLVPTSEAICRERIIAKGDMKALVRLGHAVEVRDTNGLDRFNCPTLARWD